MRPHPETISPTAHYTGTVWVRNGLAPASFATRQGEALYQGLRPMNAVLRAAGGPSLEAMLLARHQVIDHLLDRAIAAGQIGAVVELAAGLSGRGARMAARHGPAITYLETDLPHMADNKRAALARAGLGGEHHRVVAVDVLRDDGALSLSEACRELPPGRGLAVISEGLLNYFPRADVTTLWRRLRRVLAGFPHGLYLADLHLEEDNQGPLTAGFRQLLSVFVRGSVHLHFADVSTCRRELELAGFARSELHCPEVFTDLVPAADAISARRVRVVEAWA
jgi:O-methyltransferase involved in polyketide biosynthesis